jgi:hypothetical protein
MAMLAGCDAPFFSQNSIDSDEEVLFLPGLAHRSVGGRWAVRLRGYIYEPKYDSRKARALLAGLRSALEISEDAPAGRLLAERARLFLVDHERGERIRINLVGRELVLRTSGSGGQFGGAILLPPDSFRRALLASPNPRLPFFANSIDGRRFDGIVQVVDEVGVSVISDIDDTIKISNVLQKKELMRRTFLKEFEAVPGLAKLYRGQARSGHTFHYVSGSPWQLYPALGDFLSRAGFPAGSYHLRELRSKAILSFIDADPFEYKVETIGGILRSLPRREFVLIGDSGEKDPEVYTAIAQEFGRQVRSILIRDVREPGTIDTRIRSLRAQIPRTRLVVFRDASEIAGVHF